MHAWPAYGMVNIDLFSCEPFNEAAVVRFATERFGTQDVEVHAVERATRSPRDFMRRQVQPVSNSTFRGWREGRVPHTPPGIPQF